MHRIIACDIRKKCTYLLISKEDSSDEEIEDEQYEAEEEDTSVTSEEYQMENQDKDKQDTITILQYCRKNWGPARIW